MNLRKEYLGKTVLVTGHTGFKGGWLSAWLNCLGAKVVGFSKDIPSTPSFFLSNHLDLILDDQRGDIRSLDKMYAVIQKYKPDYIFHLAAQSIVSKSYNDPVETLTTNIIGTTNVLEAVKKYGEDCVLVMVTSDKSYKNKEWAWGYRETDELGGSDIYSGSKSASEMVINAYKESFFPKTSGVKVGVARAGNVIGGGDWSLDRIVPDCYRAWSVGQPIQIRNPNSTRPWQHVLEPLSGYLTLGVYLKNGMHHGGDFNFGPNFNSASFSVERLITDLYSCWPGDKSYTPYHVKPGAFKEAGLLRLNCDKALQYLNWFPTCTYEETIQMVGNWYHEYYLNSENMIRYTDKQIAEYELLGKERNCTWAQD